MKASRSRLNCKLQKESVSLVPCGFVVQLQGVQAACHVESYQGLFNLLLVFGEGLQNALFASYHHS